jgi:hypothetical protein
MNKRLKKNLRKPQKKAGVISPREFTRAGIVMSAYDEAREHGEKHSFAVKQSVEVVKQRHPRIRISEIGVKSILAKYRPRESHTILLFRRSLRSCTPTSGAHQLPLSDFFGPVAYFPIIPAGSQNLAQRPYGPREFASWSVRLR